MTRELVTCKWYFKTAVYYRGRLIYHGETGRCGLFHALGYTFRDLPEIPTHGPFVEFDKNDTGHWVPPKELSILEAQHAACKARMRQEEISSLEGRLKELRNEDKQPSS